MWNPNFVKKGFSYLLSTKIIFLPYTIEPRNEFPIWSKYVNYASLEPIGFNN